MAASNANLTVALFAGGSIGIEVVVRNGGSVIGSLSVHPSGPEWEQPDGTTLSWSWADFDQLVGGAEPAAQNAPVARSAPAKKAAAKKAPVKKAAVKKAAVKKAPVRRGSTRPGGKADPAAVRKWAQDRGIAVSSRGRISAEVLEQYQRSA